MKTENYGYVAMALNELGVFSDGEIQILTTGEISLKYKNLGCYQKLTPIMLAHRLEPVRRKLRTDLAMVETALGHINVMQTEYDAKNKDE